MVPAPHTSSSRASAQRCRWVIQPRQSDPSALGFPPSPSRSPHSCPALLHLGSRQGSAEMLQPAGPIQARRLFHPACPNPDHGHLRARPWTGSSPRSKGVLGGSLPVQPTCQIPRWTSCPRPGDNPSGSAGPGGPGGAPGRAAGDGAQPAPGCSARGKALPRPAVHLKPDSSPGSASPGGFRLPFFHHLPGTRTFVPARAPSPRRRRGVPPRPDRRPPRSPGEGGGTMATNTPGSSRPPPPPPGPPRSPRAEAAAAERSPRLQPPRCAPQTLICSSN